jgi:hypothetical protein
MKVVINKRFGGFGLSYEAVMLYAKYKGIQLLAFTEVRKADGSTYFNKYVPYDGTGEIPLCIHYSTAPLVNGKFDDFAYFMERDIPRNNPELVRVVETLGKKANTQFSDLKIVEIPDDVKYEIDDYDGQESIHEIHRSWE